MKNLSSETVRVEDTSKSPLLGEPAVPPVISQKLITEETLGKLAAGVRVVTVANTAIVTPAAWDYAKERGIQIVKGESAVASTSRDVSQGLCIIDSKSEKAAAAWKDASKRISGWSIEQLHDTASIVSRVVSSVQSGTKQLIVLSGEPWNVVCLSNRTEAVRAAVACHQEDISSIQKSLIPNVWCVPSDKTFFELRNILRSLLSETSVPSVSKKAFP